MPGRQSRKRGSDDSRTLLEIYLRDHHAAAAGGVDLARRLASHDRSLARLAEQIADDRAQLTRLLGLLEIGPNPAKIAAVRIGERLTRLKLNGRLFTHSPLSHLLELETLAVGIAGKRALWRALEVTREADHRLASLDLPALIASADAQLEQVERLRLDAAAAAFGTN